MSAVLLLISVGILLSGGLLCVVASNQAALSNRLGPAVSVLGGIPAMVAAIETLWTGQDIPFGIPWCVPLGSFSIAVDGLSAFFILAISVVCVLSAIYGLEYMKAYLGRKNLGLTWCFYNLLFASMLMVVVARNGVLFLMAWELMSLSSFFLVMFEHERESVRQAGWVYFVAMHLGTAFLFAMFALLAWQKGSMDFDQFALAPGSHLSGVLFILAVIGFGTKAGFLPLHVWLPEAHPAAPSPVSAVMSGVMIKTGIYGLLRTLMFLGPPSVWWAWTLIGVGVASGIGGVLFALAQHDLKRLLAYHSVENIGIICLGLGVWLLGMSTDNATLAALGLLGGLLHVWNHAIFKSLLFLGAGSVAHETGTRDIEQLGGLLKRMKYTGPAFLIGSAAICGLPPLNGFVSEFLIYLGALSGIAHSGASQVVVAGLVVMGSLAIIGGLATACFTKVFGIVFLGEPRSDAAERAHETPRAMYQIMGILAGLCVLIGLLGPLVVRATVPATTGLLRSSALTEDFWTSTVQRPLWYVSLAGIALMTSGVTFWMIRRRLQAGRTIAQAGTWDCGYAAPTARMQYTASSFAWPILNMFRSILRPRLHRQLPSGLFPARASFESHTEDIFHRYLYRPIFLLFGWCADRLRRLQHGRNQLYVLYIALTLLILLLWNLG